MSGDSWYEIFDLDDDLNNTGPGWTKGQVADWQLPDKGLLIDYYGWVKASAREYIESLTASEMERQLIIPPRPAASIG